MHPLFKVTFVEVDSYIQMTSNQPTDIEYRIFISSIKFFKKFKCKSALSIIMDKGL